MADTSRQRARAIHDRHPAENHFVVGSRSTRSHRSSKPPARPPENCGDRLRRPPSLRTPAWSHGRCARASVFGAFRWPAFSRPWAAGSADGSLARRGQAPACPDSTPPTAAVHFLRVYNDWLGFHAHQLVHFRAVQKTTRRLIGCGSSANVSPFSVSKQATLFFLPLLAMHASRLAPTPASSLDRHPRRSPPVRERQRQVAR